MKDFVIDDESEDRFIQLALTTGDIQKYEDIIINSGNPKYMYEFACKVILDEKLENAIIAAGDVFYIYHLCNDVQGVNIQKMEQAIIDSGNACYIYLFARNIDGANIQKLQDAVIKSEAIEYMYYFLKHVDGVDDLLLKYAIINLIKHERSTRAAYLPIETIMVPEYFSKSCELAIEYKRGKTNVKRKKRHYHI